MRDAHIIRAIFGEPWAITEDYLAIITTIARRHIAGEHLTAEEIQTRIGAARRPTPGPVAVAVLPLYGVISQRQNLMSETSGGTSTEQFRSAFRAALADPQVGAIVVDVDSPGGSVYGTDELASDIYAGRRTKPVYAVANSMAASAAYWIASAASEMYVTPSGDVGSIGVLAAHSDISKAQEMEGVATTLISAGRFKAEASPYGPLTAEARVSIQERVDEFYATFTRTVARNRGVAVEAVRGGFGEGRLVSATRAKAMGMVDGIATLDEVIQHALSRMAPPPAATATDSGIPVALHRRRLGLLAASHQAGA